MVFEETRDAFSLPKRKPLPKGKKVSISSKGKLSRLGEPVQFSRKKN